MLKGKASSSGPVVYANKLIPIKSSSLQYFQNDASSSISNVSEFSTGNMHRGYLKTRMDFLISCIGLSVTLGNIWRFPHLAYENKGVLFLAPYAILLIMFGNPLFFMEVGIGQYSGKGPTVLGKMVPLGKGIAAAMSYISLLTVSYYGALMSHCMTYILVSFQTELPWTSCQSSWGASALCFNRTFINASDTDGRQLITPAEDFYHTYVLRLDPSILHSGLGSINLRLLVYLAISWIVVFIGLVKGHSGVGKLTYIAAISPFIMLTALLIVALPLSGSRVGLEQMFNVSKLGNMDVNPQTWRRAVEQVLYSLDLSTGNLIMYGACCEFRSSSLKDMLIVTTLDLLVSVAAGSVVFSVIGALSVETNINFYYVTKTGAGLAFIGFSEAIVRMPYPRLANFLIFSCLYFVCLETQFCCLDPVFCTLFDFFPGLKRHETLMAAVICFGLFLMGIPCITGGGLYVITLMDDIGAAMGLVFIGLFEVLCVSGIYGVHRFTEDMHFMLGKRPHFVWRLLWIVGPIFLFLVVLLCTVELQNPSYGHIQFPDHASIISWISGLVAVAIIVGVGIYQVIRHYRRGELRNVLRPTSDWCPDNEMLSCARSMFHVFNSSIRLQSHWHARRFGPLYPEQPVLPDPTGPSTSREPDRQPTTRRNASKDAAAKKPGFTFSFRPPRLSFRGLNIRSNSVRQEEFI